MLSLKQGVSVSDLQPQIVLGLLVANSVFSRYAKSVVVTSGSDGQHMAGSLHYSGNAVDLRSHDLLPQTLNRIVLDLRSALGRDFDVFIESDHIHLEYDPK